jgi:hypothetical protein
MKIDLYKGKEISSIEEWGNYARLKSDKHWKDGRSAKEMAKLALSEDFRNIISTILKELSIYETSYKCEPEAKTCFGKGFGKGGPRNHDLLMIGNESIIGIEAKVSESFDKKVSEKSTARVDALIKFLYGKDIEINKDKLFYQLLTSSVGTIKEALNNGKKKAVVLFITFNGNVYKEKQYEKHIKRNTEAFCYFSESLRLNDSGKLVSIPGCDHKIECWIKHITIDIGSTYKRV